jgi:hypothetical protein
MAEDRLRAELEALLKTKDVRSADRAYMARMLQDIRRGTGLSYEERLNLWAYVTRYRRSGTPG